MEDDIGAELGARAELATCGEGAVHRERDAVGAGHRCQIFEVGRLDARAVDRLDVDRVVHPLSMASLLGEDGGPEDDTIAAWLHDAVEDHPIRSAPGDGRVKRREPIGSRLGADVAAIVMGCSDTLEDPKPGRESSPDELQGASARRAC